LPHPQRIVCLSAEAADICHRIGAWPRVVGVSAFFDQSNCEEPRPVVSGFSSAPISRILALEPDLVVTFSDVQAELAAELIREGCPVLATNQRTLAEIENTIRLLGRVVDHAGEAEALALAFRQELETLRAGPARRPRVYFEEWPEPMVYGITWVSELVELAGGEDVFARRRHQAATGRTVTGEEVIAAAPELILASWCGQPVDFETIRGREGWENIPAVKNDAVFEIESRHILQPGPALLKGARQLAAMVANWTSETSSF